MIISLSPTTLAPEGAPSLTLEVKTRVGSGRGNEQYGLAARKAAFGAAIHALRDTPQGLASLQALLDPTGEQVAKARTLQTIMGAYPVWTKGDYASRDDWQSFAASAGRSAGGTLMPSVPCPLGLVARALEGLDQVTPVAVAAATPPKAVKVKVKPK